MFFSLLFEVLSNVQKQFGHYLKRKIRKSLRIATKCITFAPHLSPDGGIGRRAGLKHQWGNPSRFDPGSGYKARVSYEILAFTFYISLKKGKVDKKLSSK